ncbi:MAG: site-2 protease family protein [Planctomycetota bacterium]
MSGWWIADLWQRGESVLLVSWLFWVVVSIVLHELGHGYAALWQGDTTPRDSGHITINPIVHMGWFSLIALMLLGIAWGLMPVNPARFRNGRLGWALVAAAGPAVNLLLSAVCVVGCALVVCFATFGEPLRGNLTEFCLMGAWLNLYLMCFNLLPMPPLDGSVILAGLSASARRFYSQPAVQQFGLIILFVVLFSGGLTKPLVTALQRTAVVAVGQVSQVLGGPPTQ